METEATTVETPETETAAPNNDDLFGDSNGNDVDMSAEQEPAETSADEQTEQADEAEAETETADETAETEEEAEPELPAQQAKAYSDELVAAYAKRFGLTLDEVKQDKRFAFMVKKAIDSDIYLNQLNSKIAELSPTEEEEEEATPAATEAEANDRQAQYDRYIAEAAQKFISPQHVEKYGREFAIAMLGNDPAKIQDPTQRAEAEAFVKRGANMAKAFLPGLIDLMETYVPQRMEAYLDAAMPGFSEQRAIQETSAVWEALRNSNPEYASFPAYGPREGDYGKFIAENAAKIPNFDKIKFDGLSRQEATAAKLQLIAQVASGKRATPQVVKQAAETAKKQVEEQNNKKATLKALGAGNSKAQLSPKKTGNDDIFGEDGEFTSKRIGY